MHDFQFVDGELFCEGVSIAAVAAKVGTPFYLYSHATLCRHLQVFDSAFSDIPHLTAFAVKSNSNLAILKLVANHGLGADIVSGGELYRALQAGIEPTKIVFAGVGKNAEEIEYALKTGIRMFNVESAAELGAINDVAARMGTKAPVALRVNPDVDPMTHPYIATGLKKSKFGIGSQFALESFEAAMQCSAIDVVGVHMHIGSQLTTVSPFVDAVKKLLGLIEQLQQRGIDLHCINVGGGLGISYEDETPPHPSDLAEALMPLLRDLKVHLILEPGRVIVGNAGILVTKVLYIKNGDGKNFVIVDAAMNDLLRPSLYDAYHKIVPVRQDKRDSMVVDVVGPICESGDFLAKDRKLPEVKPEELLAVMSAGAYAFTMASNYNARPRVPEVMVRDRDIHVIRERESYVDLVKGEVIPNFLQ
ncbi:MAG TPA: diaminopimelate decarboxylase [Nitrospirales bacterium]|nr:diaminopimelate decarboxylase [Nitrospirales bacterium]HIB53691.1 diaminopimelate decarboxylase [Nitrospirales bacterium]HIC04503.1 diaminopimelate decarboxylase [Nitrospirales bacterium]HIN32798.1 diaminopimelate decarboxylase [Nitrospirales bacterium]HIO22305.1 diaminopimelate decarboxylase [Nitrospirales bacterium]